MIELFQTVVDDFECRLAMAKSMLHRAMFKEHPYQVGDILRISGGSRSKVHFAQVRRLYVDPTGSVRMELAPRIANGSFSKHNKMLYGGMTIEKITPVELPLP